MNVIVLMLSIVLAAAQGAKVGEVETSFDKRASFQAFKTYSWQPGYDAYDPAIHKLIVSAIDQEMAGLGFAKVASGADVTIAYYSVLSTEVDLKALEKLQREGKATASAEKSLGRLMVIMRKPNVEERLWSATTREHISREQAEATIRTVAKRLFEKYPGRVGAKN
jgi:hypothetical protein